MEIIVFNDPPSRMFLLCIRFVLVGTDRYKISGSKLRTSGYYNIYTIVIGFVLFFLSF